MTKVVRLTEYLDSVKAERNALETVDIDAVVAERLEAIKLKIRGEIIEEIEKQKFVADIRIKAIEDALEIVSAPVESEETATEESYQGDYV